MKYSIEIKCDNHCCCNCKHQIKLFCHPQNKSFGKGSIVNLCGYACACPELNDKSAIFSDTKHGMCEMYEKA